MHFAIVSHSKDVFFTQHDLPWAEVIAALTDYTEGEKDGEAWIPARMRMCPDECAGIRGVNCGGNKPHRLAANVTHMSGFAVDLDHGDFDAYVKKFSSLGLEFIYYETYTAGRGRFFFPFAEELAISPTAWKKAWMRIAAHLGFSTEVDDKCKDAARIYYSPRKPAGEERKAGHKRGVRLDGKAFYVHEEEAPVKRQERAPAPVGEVDTAPMIARFEKISNEGCQRILKGKHPTVSGSRDSAWVSATAAFSLAFRDGEDSEGAVLHLLETAWRDDCAAHPGDEKPWERIEKLWSDALASAPAYKAKKEAENLFALEGLKESLRTKEKASVVVSGVTDAPPTEKKGYTTLLKYVKNKEGATVIAPTPANASIILEHHDAWAGKIRFNTYSQVIELHNTPINRQPMEVLEEQHMPAIVDWLAEEGVKVTELGLWSRMMRVARTNEFNPVEDFLRREKWDGVERIDTFLKDYLECTDDEAYLKSISGKFFVAAVARGISKQAEQVDHMLVIEGDQGAGKTSFFRTLSGGFFASEQLRVGDKDTADLMCTTWICESGELSDLKRSDLEELKSFITKTQEKYRAPYARASKVHNRRAVLVGTTNSREYLTDPTGARRFWCVKTDLVDIDLVKVRAVLGQLWAEALVRYEAGAVWHLNKEEKALQSSAAGDRGVQDLAEGKILEHYLTMNPKDRPSRVTLTHIVEEVLKEDIMRANVQRVGAVMRKLGFVPTRIGTLRAWAMPMSILHADKLMPEKRLTVVKEAHEKEGT